MCHTKVYETIEKSLGRERLFSDIHTGRHQHEQELVQCTLTTTLDILKIFKRAVKLKYTFIIYEYKITEMYIIIKILELCKFEIMML